MNTTSMVASTATKDTREVNRAGEVGYGEIARVGWKRVRRSVTGD